MDVATLVNIDSVRGLLTLIVVVGPLMAPAKSTRNVRGRGAFHYPRYLGPSSKDYIWIH